MNFSAFNVNFNSPSLDSLGLRRPAHKGIKQGYPPKTRLHFTAVGCARPVTLFSECTQNAIDTSLHNHCVQCQLLGSVSLDFVCSGASYMHRCHAFALRQLGFLVLLIITFIILVESQNHFLYDRTYVTVKLKVRVVVCRLSCRRLSVVCHGCITVAKSQVMGKTFYTNDQPRVL